MNRAQRAGFHARYMDEQTGLVFEWYGGPYIDVGYMNGGAFRALEVINVWGSHTNEPTIPRTEQAFLEQVRGWLNNPGNIRNMEILRGNN